MGSRAPRRRSPLFGILSICAFLLFWVFLVLAFNSMMVAAGAGDAKRFVASGALAMFSFLLPLIGLALGIVGVVKANAQKVVGGIGLALNALLLVWLLIGMLSHH